MRRSHVKSIHGGGRRLRSPTASSTTTPAPSIHVPCTPFPFHRRPVSGVCRRLHANAAQQCMRGNRYLRCGNYSTVGAPAGPERNYRNAPILAVTPPRCAARSRHGRSNRRRRVSRRRGRSRAGRASEDRGRPQSQVRVLQATAGGGAHPARPASLERQAAHGRGRRIAGVDCQGAVWIIRRVAEAGWRGHPLPDRREDEADPASGKISYVSPIARLLIGAAVGMS